MSNELDAALDRLDARIESVNRELTSLRRHKNAPAAVQVGNLDDMQRLASLFSHDLARSSSTNGELALASCVEWLVEKVRETQRELQRARRHPSSFDE